MHLLRSPALHLQRVEDYAERLLISCGNKCVQGRRQLGATVSMAVDRSTAEGGDEVIPITEGTRRVFPIIILGYL